MTARELFARLAVAGAAIDLAGDGRIRLRLLTTPLPEGLAIFLRENDALVLSWLRRREEAFRVTCRAVQQAAGLLHGAGVCGGERLRAADVALHEAFWHSVDAGDLRSLRAACADYLELARELRAEGSRNSA